MFFARCNQADRDCAVWMRLRRTSEQETGEGEEFFFFFWGRVGRRGGGLFFLRTGLEAERVNKWICMAGLCEVDR